ncbi:MAG: hypothetical protein Q9225_006826, partial [Loekoesia sp. 1 TL-2023]
GNRIPVWPINAAYLGPLSLFLYFRYGRPSHPSEGAKGCHEHSKPDNKHSKDHVMHRQQAHDSQTSSDTEKGEGHAHAHHSMGNTRPMWATVAIRVSHCGAGCVLGDLVGEWLVYGTSATINSRSIWPELLIDYAFALLFGIIFQYFSIAPMSGDYSPQTLVRALKADILSLTSFEIGLFGWMVAYQVGIWGYRLEMTTWTYWWMMQVGMFIGFWTATPVNWWLIREKIKEPCA